MIAIERNSVDNPSTASSEYHRDSIATVFKKKYTEKPTKENISELINEKKLILEPPLKIDEVIKQFSSIKNIIEVASLSIKYRFLSNVAHRQMYQR